MQAAFAMKPGSILQGFQAFPSFPKWLGKLSTTGKNKRLTQEIVSHTMENIGQVLCYWCVLVCFLLFHLLFLLFHCFIHIVSCFMSIWEFFNLNTYIYLCNQLFYCCIALFYRVLSLFAWHMCPICHAFWLRLYWKMAVPVLVG